MQTYLKIFATFILGVLCVSAFGCSAHAQQFGYGGTNQTSTSYSMQQQQLMQLYYQHYLQQLYAQQLYYQMLQSGAYSSYGQNNTYPQAQYQYSYPNYSYYPGTDYLIYSLGGGSWSDSGGWRDNRGGWGTKYYSSGTVDPNNYRNSVYSFDGEVLTIPD